MKVVGIIRMHTDEREQAGNNDEEETISGLLSPQFPRVLQVHQRPGGVIRVFFC
jgi:hypothetical protein